VKWHQCPTLPLPVYPSILGATNAPFIHPGHEIRIVLNADEVASTGGFSVDPDGNLVAIKFASLSGDPVVLPLRRAAGTTPSVLSFSFPDSVSEVGRVLAGPVDIQVTSGARLVAHIGSRDLVGLPPTNDVTGIVLGQDPDQSVLAALSARGDLWIPTSFQGEPMVMPSCPGNFIFPLDVEVAAATVDGLSYRGENPLSRIHRTTIYLGDTVINDESFYGMLFPQRISLIHVAGTLGVSICRLNDAMDIVLRVKGNQSWARGPRSAMRAVVGGSAPLSLRLHSASQVPGAAAQRLQDSFGNACSRTPPTASPKASGAQSRP
jgi:hypothetical protein